MARKRVHALRRGPDGSGFLKCESCGLSVPVALVDMHECGIKKSKTLFQIGKQRIQDQPRSAFRFFMEEFMTSCSNGNEIEIENKGFDKWKSMSKEERLPFHRRADKVNSAYVRLLRKEEREMQIMQWVDDEADSAEVGMFDKNYVNLDSECSDGLGHSSFYSEESFCAGTWDWLTPKVA